MRLRYASGCFRAVIVTAVLASGATAAEPDRDLEYLSGLRDRRLYELASGFCARTLQSPDLEPSRRVALTVEWLRTLTALARELPPGSRGPAWQRAHSVAEAFPQEHPQRERVVLQHSLVWLAEAELAGWEAEGRPPGDRRWEEARQPLRAAILELEGLEQRVKLPPPAPPVSSTYEASAERRLRRSVAVALARAYRLQAATYPRASPDWVAALTQAMDRLEGIAESPDPAAAAWQARLDWAACQRALGRYEAATTLLTQLPEKLPDKFAMRQQVERIRLALARDDLLAAEALVARSPNWPSAEWEFVRLEILLAKLERTEDDGERQRLFEQAAARINSLELRHGAYWMRRGELRLARLVAVQGSSTAAALLRAAASYARSGQWEDAFATYDAASRSAQQAGDGKAAFDAAFAAATLTHHRKQHAAAVERFRGAADSFRHHPRAGIAHQLAIVHQAELLRRAQTEDRPAALEKYRSLLHAHLSAWPTDPTTPAVRRWLAELYRAERNWRHAAEQYQAIPPADAAFAGVVEGLVECWKRTLDGPSVQGVTQAKQAARQLEGVAQRIEGATAQDARRRWTALVAAAEFYLDAAAGGDESTRCSQRAGAVLATLEAARGTLPAELVQRARGVRTVAAAATGDFSAARREAAEMDGALPEPLLKTLDRLAPLSGDEAGGLRLQLCDLLAEAGNTLADRQRRRLGWHRAAALTACGRRAEAVPLFRQLSEADPSDVEARLGLATALAASPETTDLRAAAGQLLELEKQLTAGSSRWFEARLRRAELLARLAGPGQAEKLIRITRALYPGLGGPSLAGEFEQLLAELESDAESR